MGAVGKALGKVMKAVTPLVSKFNPLLGAGMALAGGLLSGEKPLKALLSAAGSIIPGGGPFKNVLANFGGEKLMEGMGGNSLVSAALNLATGKGKVTDIAKELLKATQKKDAMTEQSLHNTTELMAQRMAALTLSA
jgi:hypothetical protein